MIRSSQIEIIGDLSFAGGVTTGWGCFCSMAKLAAVALGKNFASRNELPSWFHGLVASSSDTIQYWAYQPCRRCIEPYSRYSGQEVPGSICFREGLRPVDNGHTLAVFCEGVNPVDGCKFDSVMLRFPPSQAYGPPHWLLQIEPVNILDVTSAVKQKPLGCFWLGNVVEAWGRSLSHTK